MGEAEIVDTGHGDRVQTPLGRTLSRRSVLRALGGGPIGLLGGPDRIPYSPAAAIDARSTSARLQADARPNILLILLDDLRADDVTAMPAVQALLAEEGTSFTNFISTAPLCAPARASILRGQYPHNHGVLRGAGELGGFDLFQTLGHEQSTVATWLHDAGYSTALIGKYLNGYPSGDGLPADVTESYVPAGWDEWVGMTDEGYFRFAVNENGEPVASRTGKRRQFSSRVQDRNPYSVKRKNLYSTDFFASKAATFIERTAQSGRPFFVYLAPYAIHGPAEPALRHASTFAGTSAPRSAAFNEADVTDKPAMVQAMPEMSAGQIAALDERHARRLETLQAVDEMVAILVDVLQAAGALEQTYIVLSSDNGYHLGEHRLAFEKGTPYEEAIRVPLVVRGPGVPAGQTVPALTSQVDLAPTFATWGDATVPDFVDGRSLAPLLSQEPRATPWRETVLVEHSAHTTMHPSTFQALRDMDRVYVEYATGDRELYNLVDDPYQLENLASSAEPALIQTLSARLAAMAMCTGETCRAIESAPL